jgi:diguanylate cyclase (GGDEF)-like protein
MRAPSSARQITKPARPMAMSSAQFESCPPERFVAEVFSELGQEVMQRRWREVQVILRLSILSGLEMQLDATLNMLCDFAAEITAYDGVLVYFWDENTDHVQVQIKRGLEAVHPDVVERGNILNFWASKYSRPMLVERGHNVQADSFLDETGRSSALVVPLFVRNRVIGTMQLFSRESAAFAPDDAQLLWMLALVAENLLTREYTNEGLIRYAFTDYLTGLKTRGYFEQQLELEFKRSERKKEHIALLMIDIDHFKQLNDTYGHHVGDQVLRDVSAILIKDMREVDTVARYGGEEFVIILPETNGPGALLVAERLRKGVEQAKFFAGSPDQVERLSISIGIAIYDTDAQFKRDLIEFADAALYAAKSSGRNQVRLYSELARERKQAS